MFDVARLVEGTADAPGMVAYDAALTDTGTTSHGRVRDLRAESAGRVTPAVDIACPDPPGPSRRLDHARDDLGATRGTRTGRADRRVREAPREHVAGSGPGAMRRARRASGRL